LENPTIKANRCESAGRKVLVLYLSKRAWMKDCRKWGKLSVQSRAMAALAEKLGLVFRGERSTRADGFRKGKTNGAPTLETRREAINYFCFKKFSCDVFRKHR